MHLRWLVTALTISLSVVPSLQAQSEVKFFPLSEVRPGLEGVGRTVFDGDRIEEFQVHILGVMKNAIGPKHTVILARLSGGSLEHMGVALGMSGSPVYIDGRLVGAVALSFPFSKEPLAGITPIEEMLEVVPGAEPLAPTVSAPKLSYHLGRTATETLGGGRLIPDEEDGVSIVSKLLPSMGEGATLASLRLPLHLGGFSNQVVQTYTPLFRQMGFELAGGALSADESTSPISSALQPGSMISLLLMRGDFNLSGDCTVTYRQENNLYACGHRLFLMGPAQIPFAPARVLITVPNLANSFKLAAPGPSMGTIRQDRFGAVYGSIGDKASMIPVHIQVDSTLNRKTDYEFEMVQEPFLSPLLLNLVVVSTLTATERMLGPSTLEVKGKIRLSRDKYVAVEDVVSADMNTAGSAGGGASMPLAYLLAGGFMDLRIDGIDLSIVSRNEKRVATLDSVWSSKSEVRPGDHIEVAALLRTASGETLIQKIPVDVPESVRDKLISLVVGSGPTINALQAGLGPLNTTPRDLPQLVRNLNRMRHNDRLYALLMAPQRSFVLQGDEYPSPPPSLIQTFLADPAASSSAVFSSSSVIGDFETQSSPYSIRGQKTLVLKVVGTGS